MNKNLYLKRDKCPICQSSNLLVLLSKSSNNNEFVDFLKIEEFYTELFWKDYKNGLLDNYKFEILKCKACSFIFQGEALNNKGMSLLYNYWLDQDKLLEYYKNVKMEKSQLFWPKIIKNHFRNKTDINAMDFGAGYGNFCKILIDTGFKTYALDLSDDKNNHLSSMGVNVINNLTDYDSFFDFIYVNQVFEHVENPLKILKNLQKALNKNGFIFVAVPGCKNIEKIIKTQGLSNDLFLLLSPQQHINAFNNKTLRLLGKKAGLKNLSVTDFFKFFNKSLSKEEFKLILKAILKTALKYRTGIFLKKYDK